MMNILTFCILLLFAYLLGSISTGILVAKAAGFTDPRKHGSGNPGATNVLRVGGKGWGAVVLILDALKGLLPTLLAVLLALPHWAIGMVSLAAVVGHMYPVFFKFQGGKGVATGLGAMIAMSWGLGAAFVITWIVSAIIFRYSSLSALIAIALCPFYAWWLVSGAYVLPLSLIALLVIYRHRSNIRRLLCREEPRLGRKSNAA